MRPPMMNIPEQPIQVVVKSALRSLSLWAACWFFVVHLCVIWKWMTPGSDSSSSSRTMNDAVVTAGSGGGEMSPADFATYLRIQDLNETLQQLEAHHHALLEQNIGHEFDAVFERVQTQRQLVQEYMERFEDELIVPFEASYPPLTETYMDMGQLDDQHQQPVLDLSHVESLLVLLKDPNHSFLTSPLDTLELEFEEARNELRQLQDAIITFDDDDDDVDRTLLEEEPFLSSSFFQSWRAAHALRALVETTEAHHLDLRYVTPDCARRPIQVEYIVEPPDEVLVVEDDDADNTAIRVAERLDQHPDVLAHHDRVLTHIHHRIQQRLQLVLHQHDHSSNDTDGDDTDTEDVAVALRATYQHVVLHAMDELESILLECTAKREFMEELQARMHDAIQSIQLYNDQVVAHEEKDAMDDGDCVVVSQVLHWLEIGLEAHARKQSVRDALLLTLHHDARVNASTVMLNEEEEDAMTTTLKLQDVQKDAWRRRRQKYNVRRWLDTPLTQQLAVGVDAFIETIEGSSEWIDQMVDAAYTSMSAGDDDEEKGGGRGGDPFGPTTLGQYVVHQALYVVGVLSDTIQDTVVARVMRSNTSQP